VGNFPKSLSPAFTQETGRVLRASAISSGRTAPALMLSENSFGELPSDGRTVTSLEHPKPVEKPSIRPPGGWAEKSFRQEQIRNYLEDNFSNPLPPDSVVLDPLADLIPNEQAFMQFQDASENFVPNNGWKGFIKIARACSEKPTPKTHQQAKAAGGTLPKWADEDWVERLISG
jgi:hypothetical protein